jgi:probable O-glycosylation ligase (exosortase A-associated)
MLVTSRLRVHALIVMIVIATCVHGALDGLKFVASGGSHNAQTIPKFGDNNHLAMVLLMVLPLAYYLIQNSKLRLARLGFSAAILLTVLAVVATHSRGGLIGLFAVAFWIVMQGRRKMWGLVLVLLCAFLVLKMAPDSWSERMGTIQEADKDQSFMERVTAWKVSSAIALAHPVFGGGFRAVQSHPVWDKYAHSQGILGFVESPVIERSGVAAHSMWFEVMGDLGFVGFFLFVALLVNAFLTRRAIRRLVKEQGVRARWAGDLADMLGASLFVYMVTGSSLSVAYFELPYICMMVMEVVRLQLVRQARSSLSVPAGQG